MGSVNGIIGDDNFGTELPQTQVDDENVTELKRLAKYAKSAEFKKQKAYWESRMDFYKTYLPDGKPVATTPPSELPAYWIAANVIIGEIETYLGAYASAAESAKELK